jgi:hypothetical protein
MTDGPALARMLVLAACVWTSAQAAPVNCPPSPDLDETASLPLLKQSLKQGGQLDVLVVGSALTQAGAPSPPAASSKPGAGRAGYAGEMARALEASVHGLHVNLSFDGKRFMSAQELVDVMSADLVHQHYGLVLWQTGTADAVRGEPMGDFYQALSDGAVAAASAGAALVLVDPQYSRFLEANADIAPYLSSMQAIASTSGVLLFDRYAIMRDWAEAGVIDLENATAGDRPAVAARLHVCLGEQLARTLLAAVAAAP